MGNTTSPYGYRGDWPVALFLIRPPEDKGAPAGPPEMFNVPSGDGAGPEEGKTTIIMRNITTKSKELRINGDFIMLLLDLFSNPVSSLIRIIGCGRSPETTTWIYDSARFRTLEFPSVARITDPLRMANIQTDALNLLYLVAKPLKAPTMNIC
jgi:hypothetical protein